MDIGIVYRAAVEDTKVGGSRELGIFRTREEARAEAGETAIREQADLNRLAYVVHEEGALISEDGSLCVLLSELSCRLNLINHRSVPRSHPRRAAAKPE